MRNGGLGHAVDRRSRERDGPGLRAEVDDLAAAVLDHDAAHLLGGEEQALEVGRDHDIVGFFGHVFGGGAPAESRVVHENVDAPEVVDRFGDRTGYLGEAGNVHLERQHAAPETVDGVDQLFPGGFVA